MIPGMVFAILTRDPDFADDFCRLLRLIGAEAYPVSSWDEYSRIQEEGVVVEMYVVDPVFRVA